MEKTFKDLRQGEISVHFRQEEHGLGNDFSSVIRGGLTEDVLGHLEGEKST